MGLQERDLSQDSDAAYGQPKQWITTVHILFFPKLLASIEYYFVSIFHMCNSKYRFCFVSFFYWKGRLTGRKRYREKDPQSAGLLPKVTTTPELNLSEARCFFQVCPMGTGAQGFGPVSTAFPGQKQGGINRHSYEIAGAKQGEDFATEPLRQAQHHFL